MKKNLSLSFALHFTQILCLGYNYQPFYERNICSSRWTGGNLEIKKCVSHRDLKIKTMYSEA